MVDAGLLRRARCMQAFPQAHNVMIDGVNQLRLPSSCPLCPSWMLQCRGGQLEARADETQAPVEKISEMYNCFIVCARKNNSSASEDHYCNLARLAASEPDSWHAPAE